MKERIGNAIGRLESLPQSDQYNWYWAKLVKEKLADKGSPPVELSRLLGQGDYHVALPFCRLLYLHPHLLSLQNRWQQLKRFAVF